MRGHVQSGALLLHAAEQALALWLVLQFPSCCEICAYRSAKVLSQTFRVVIILSPTLPVSPGTQAHCRWERRLLGLDQEAHRRPRERARRAASPQSRPARRAASLQRSSELRGADLEALWDPTLPSLVSVALPQESLDSRKGCALLP